MVGCRDGEIGFWRRRILCWRGNHMYVCSMLLYFSEGIFFLSTLKKSIFRSAHQIIAGTHSLRWRE